MPIDFSHLLRAFRHRSYRLFFLGQAVAITGTWMSIAGLGWLIFRLTGDSFMLGLMMFCRHAPTFVLAPFGGLLVDHVSRRNVIMGAQIADTLTISTLAYLTLSGRVEVWHVLTICVLLGVSKSFEMPARQALVVDIVEEREHLSNAIALNSTLFHSARLTGPMIAGMFIIPRYGEGGCFLVHALCYLLAIRCFAALHPREPERPDASVSLFRKLKEGFDYAFGFPPVRALLLLVTVFAFMGQSYNTLLPVFADEVFGGDAATYGQLLAAGGFGAVISAVRLANRKSVLGLGRVIFLSILLFGLSLIAFSRATYLPVALVLQVLAGMSGINVMVGTNTIIQTLVEDHLRGRVMSLMGMVFLGSMPLGSLAYGRAAAAVGAPLAVTCGAIGCILAGLLFGSKLPTLREAARPVYQRRGILK